MTGDHLPPTPRRHLEVQDLGLDPELPRAAEEVRRRLPHVTDEQFQLVAARHYGESAERIVAAVAQAWPRHEGTPGPFAGPHYAAVQRGVDSLHDEGTLTPTLGQIASRLGIDPATLRRWRHQDPAIEDLVR
jgi:hypothetical protein